MTTQASPATEEYLQAAYTLAEGGGQVIGARLAAFLRISPAAVSEMVHRLERDGLLQLDDRKEVHLTERGLTAASSIIRRHRLAERMLVDLLGYEWWKTMPGLTPTPTRPLERLAVGESATVERIPDQFEREPGFLEYLDTQGMRPGVTLEMSEQRPGMLRVGVDGNARSLRPDCGQKVWVAI